MARQKADEPGTLPDETVNPEGRERDKQQIQFMIIDGATCFRLNKADKPSPISVNPKVASGTSSKHKRGPQV